MTQSIGIIEPHKAYEIVENGIKSTTRTNETLSPNANIMIFDAPAIVTELIPLRPVTPVSVSPALPSSSPYIINECQSPSISPYPQYNSPNAYNNQLHDHERCYMQTPYIYPSSVSNECNCTECTCAINGCTECYQA
eukprot:TRINITY_DN11571_c0_g1_i1.p1 TRINITY_DN11571_c0_g1~~TRINITY_DN11571_c0_g1_i1.p1  ORF type:complete len:137 (-),score=10.00 TRINITY_DN11571_c0_g1_i1:10-420(-)